MRVTRREQLVEARPRGRTTTLRRPNFPERSADSSVSTARGRGSSQNEQHSRHALPGSLGSIYSFSRPRHHSERPPPRIPACQHPQRRRGGSPKGQDERPRDGPLRGQQHRHEDESTYQTYSTGVTARERPPLPRLGNGYEPPGKLDCFADGTPALGEPLPEQWTETIKKKKKKARNPRKKMPPEVMDAVHEKLVEATNRRCDPDRGDLFDVADKDASGTMELDELKKLVRVTLRIPPGELSNDMIKGVFQAIDYSGNGSIETSEFEAFLEHGSSVMHMSQQITEVVTSVVWAVETNPSLLVRLE